MRSISAVMSELHSPLLDTRPDLELVRITPPDRTCILRAISHSRVTHVLRFVYTLHVNVAPRMSSCQFRMARGDEVEKLTSDVPAVYKFFTWELMSDSEFAPNN